MPREAQQQDWRRLAKALRDRGVRPAQIRRTNDGFSIITADGRVRVPHRTGPVTAEQWAEAVTDRLLESIRQSGVGSHIA